MERFPDGSQGPVGGTIAIPILNGLALREAIVDLLPSEAPGLTRDEIWNALPEELRVNDVRFRSVLECEADRLWRKGKRPGGAVFTYRRLATDS